MAVSFERLARVVLIVVLLGQLPTAWAGDLPASLQVLFLVVTAWLMGIPGEGEG